MTPIHRLRCVALASLAVAADPALAPDETLDEDDYDGASAALHVDRGHQAPLAAFSGTPFWGDTNVLSNITPQASPSKADIDITRAIVDAGRGMGIAVHDHLIVGTSGHVSLRAKGLM